MKARKILPLVVVRGDVGNMSRHQMRFCASAGASSPKRALYVAVTGQPLCSAARNSLYPKSCTRRVQTLSTACLETVDTPSNPGEHTKTQDENANSGVEWQERLSLRLDEEQEPTSRTTDAG